MTVKTRAKKSTKSQRTEKYSQVTEKIIKLLEEGVKPWQKSWSATPYQNLISKHVYRGCNPILLNIDRILNDWELPYFATFNQAKQNGWTVKKGSKATAILYASSFSKKVENDRGEEENINLWVNRWNNVFNVACFDDSEADKKIADFIDLQEVNNDNQPIEIVEQLITKQKAKVKFGGDRASYSPSVDVICMPHLKSFTSEHAYYSTYLHELIHWSGHESRLDRDMSGFFGSQKYAFEELVAETGSAFLCNELMPGCDTELENHASYLDHWIAILKADNKAFFKAVSKAQKAADYLLDR